MMFDYNTKKKTKLCALNCCEGDGEQLGSLFLSSLSLSLSPFFSHAYCCSLFDVGKMVAINSEFCSSKVCIGAVRRSLIWSLLYGRRVGVGGGVGVGVERERKKNGTVLPQNLWANITFSVQWWSLRAVSGCHNDSFGYGPVVGEHGSILHMTCIPRSNCLCQWPWAYLDGLFGSVFLGQVILVT